MVCMLVSRKPAAALAPYVEKLWYCDGYRGVHRKERILPNGRFQLVFSLAEGPLRAPGSPAEEWGKLAPSLVLGIRTHYSVIHTGILRSAMGVVFWPGGARAFFDSPADAFHNDSVPLDLIWGSGACELRDDLRAAGTARGKFRALEKALLQRIDKRFALHAAVQYALGEFQHAPHVRRVLAVAKEAGLSRRRFAQVFREQVGLTPKLYCRLHRFQSAVRQIAVGGPVDWADIAMAGGYFDQAHLANEFRDFSGISPGAYLASERLSWSRVLMD
ncbi:MAG TPA: helix-turn-helix domain-containing protein [Terriglobales bacterium]|nr:helix-turn-helix domain-containing protein [Terriglobales bacterium]